MKNHPFPNTRYRASKLSAFGGIALVTALCGTGNLERPELITQDVRFTLRPPRSSRAKIVLVPVGNNTIDAAWPEPMAFWGARFARVIEVAHQNDAKGIGLDFILAASADETVSRELDAALERAKEPDALAERLRGALPLALRPWQTFQRALETAEGRVVLADDPGVQSAELELLRHDLDASRGRMGFVNLPLSPDGIARSMPLYEKRDGVLFPSFTALAVAQSLGLDAQDEAVLRRMGGMAPGKAENAIFRINYTGEKPDESFPVIPAERLATGELSEKEKALLQGAIVLIGTTFAGSPDRHLGPIRQPYFGVEVQAQAIATLLDARPLKRGTPTAEALITLLVGIAGAWAVSRLSFWRGLGFTFSGVLGWCLLAQALFTAQDRLLPVVGPALTLALAFAACHIARSLEEARGRRRVESAFGRTVSPAISAHLLENPERLRLGGEESEGAVLFFDARGSTHFARRYPPETVFAEMNALFAVVVPIIEAQGGLLYHYTGDGFLAVFGVPVAQANYREAALQAAHAIMETVRELNRKQPRIDGQPWRVGCGVHAGKLAFGNLGVSERAEFTVIGDTVNVAARLEGLNKTLRSEIVVSAETVGEFPPDWLRGPVAMPIAGREADGTQNKMQVYYACLEADAGR